MESCTSYPDYFRQLNMTILILFVLGCTIAISLLFWSGYRLSAIYGGIEHAEIAFPPHELRFREVVLAILTLMIKSIFNLARRSDHKSGTESTNELTLCAPFSLSKDDVARYHLAIGLTGRSSNELPYLTLPLFLSAVTEPAMLLLLVSPRCKINPLGAVNVRNRFEIIRPGLCQPHLFTQRNSAGLVARVRNESRLVKRGVEHDLEVAIMVPDQARVEDAGLITVFRQIFTMLEFTKTKAVANVKTANRRESPFKMDDPGAALRQISFSGKDPLYWAALCKDYNLIHLAGFAAKWFGLPGKLAHGNHVVAKAMQRLVEENDLQWKCEDPIWMEVQFKRPLVVPGVLDVRMHQAISGNREVSISHKGRENAIVELGTLPLQKGL